MDPEAFWNRLMKRLEDPKVKEKIRTGVTSLRADLWGFLKELGFDPEKDVVYAAALSSVVTAMLTSDLQDSSERLEGISGQALEETRNLKELTSDLLGETRTLKSLTRWLVGLTVVLSVLTAVEIFHVLL